MAVVGEQRRPAADLAGKRDLARPDDAVAWLTTQRRLGRSAQELSAGQTQKRLLITCVSLVSILFMVFARLSFLLTKRDAQQPVDTLLIPVALLSLLLLMLATISWDRVQQRHLRHLRQRSAEAISNVRQTGERRLAALMSGTSDVVLVLAPDATVTYCSAMSATVLGRTPASMRGRHLDDFLAHDDAVRLRESLPQLSEGSQLTLELLATRRDGRTIPVEVTVTARMADSAVGGFVVTIRDNSETSELAARLAHQALVDPLTGLGNRRQFTSLVGAQLRHPTDSASTVVSVGAMNFSDINRRLGYTVGDQTIMGITDRLRETVQADAVLARIGGDSFGVLLNSDDLATAEEMADRVARALSQPLQVQSESVDVRFRIGISRSTTDQGAGELIEQAEAALESTDAPSRIVARVPISHFDDRVHGRELDRAALRGDLERAIQNDQLQMAFQTIVDLCTGEVRGVEALTRWEHPERGWISPEQFVPLAERSGLMDLLGEWILRHACAAAVRFQRLGNPIVSINVSALQLSRPDFVVQLLGILDEFGLQPDRLLLEITETAMLVGLDEVIPRLTALRSVGVNVSMDDFGTGYSSLSYLSRLPLDELKIDRSFVSRVTHDTATQSVVKGMIEMSSALGLITVGEGVETEEQAAWLRDAGCVLGQGYLFSEPVGEPQAMAAFSRLTRVPPQPRIRGV